MNKHDVLIVGAGITGITAASILARDLNRKVLIVEKRDHIGGNCHDCLNEDGILIHLYGPHIFHTQHQDVWEYLSRFTEWTDYIHHVKAFIDGKHISFPININTLEQLFDRSFTKEEMKTYIEQEKVDFPEIRNAEEMVLSRMGNTIYEKFFKHYTLKQWGVSASTLSPDVTARIPIRYNRDDRFFTDPFQGMPTKGYTHMFENMLNHENIKILLETDYADICNSLEFNTLIYTGPIDAFFNYKYGRLPYRGINFDFETLDRPLEQPVAVVNYPNENAYTRITEFKHLTGQAHPKTTLCYEYPADVIPGAKNPVPSYPILNPESAKLLEQYQSEADKLKNIIFMGRLGKFEYLNMDICVKQVMTFLS